MTIAVLSQSERKHLLERVASSCGPLEPRWACMLHALGDSRPFVSYRGASRGDGDADEHEYEVVAGSVDYSSTVYVLERDLPDRSQDAATALIRAILPDAAWGVSVEPALQIKPPFDVKYHAFVGDHYPHLGVPPGKWWGESSYMEGAALALCEALLRAVIAKAEAEAKS